MWFVFGPENKISTVIRICSYGCVGFSRNGDYLRVKYTGGQNVCKYVCISLNMYTIMYVYGCIICIWVYYYVYVFISLCLCVSYMYILCNIMHLYMCVHHYVCMWIIMYVYVLLYMYMCVSLYVCMYYYALGWPKSFFSFKVEIKDMLFIFINHFTEHHIQHFVPLP